MDRTTEITSVLWLGTAIMLFLAFVLIFLAAFYKNYMTRMKREEAENLLLVSLESTNAERRRIAADLHDSVSGDLVAIRNYLSILQKSGDGPVDQSIWAELREGVENALLNTRQVSYKLMPPLLDTIGLMAAINDYFERLAPKTSVDFSAIGEIGELPQEISYELFRTVQEFTTNMLKYGEATFFSVEGSDANGVVSLRILDDGNPFDFFALLATGSGAGLKNIRDRLKVVGATLTQQPTAHGNDFIITLKRKK